GTSFHPKRDLDSSNQSNNDTFSPQARQISPQAKTRELQLASARHE
ncbi:hypothetical protein L195_g043257, partial [Trifolium pratense]